VIETRDMVDVLTRSGLGVGPDVPFLDIPCDDRLNSPCSRAFLNFVELISFSFDTTFVSLV